MIMMTARLLTNRWRRSLRWLCRLRRAQPRLCCVILRHDVVLRTIPVSANAPVVGGVTAVIQAV
jgi:hypothetical protein